MNDVIWPMIMVWRRSTPQQRCNGNSEMMRVTETKVETTFECGIAPLGIKEKQATLVNGSTRLEPESGI